jgi:putative redox protein
MSDDLTATLTWTKKLHFEGRGATPHTVPVDYKPPLGEDDGLRPMELVLMSLAACSGQTVISLLTKMKQKVRGFTVTASGKRKNDHPTVFTDIRVDFAVEGTDVDPAAVEKAIAYSEEKYCPVWAMLKTSVNVTSGYLIR